MQFFQLVSKLNLTWTFQLVQLTALVQLVTKIQATVTDANQVTKETCVKQVFCSIRIFYNVCCIQSNLNTLNQKSQLSWCRKSQLRIVLYHSHNFKDFKYFVHVIHLKINIFNILPHNQAFNHYQSHHFNKTLQIPTV